MQWPGSSSDVGHQWDSWWSSSAAGGDQWASAGRPLLYVEKAHPTEDEYSMIMACRGALPKRMKIMERGWSHQELKRMQNEERDSALRRNVDRKHEEMIVYQEKVEKDAAAYREKVEKDAAAYQEKVEKDAAAYKEINVVEVEKIVYVEKDAPPSKPLYAGGQAVHQFWAGWMEGCSERPAGIKGKARPAWFSSLVFAATALSPSMRRCRNDRDFTRHQLSRSLSFRHLGMLGDRNVPR